MKKETQNLEALDLSKKGTVIDNILAKKLVGGGSSDAGIIAPCVHPVTPPPPPKTTAVG